jgi:hypothetical protein
MFDGLTQAGALLLKPAKSGLCLFRPHTGGFPAPPVHDAGLCEAATVLCYTNVAFKKELIPADVV